MGICIEVFKEAGLRSGLSVDGAPWTGDGRSAFELVAEAGNAREAKSDPGGKQLNGEWRQRFAVNNSRVIEEFARTETAIGCAGNSYDPTRPDRQTGEIVLFIGWAVLMIFPEKRAVG